MELLQGAFSFEDRRAVVDWGKGIQCGDREVGCPQRR